MEEDLGNLSAGGLSRSPGLGLDSADGISKYAISNRKSHCRRHGRTATHVNRISYVVTSVISVPHVRHKG